MNHLLLDFDGTLVDSSEGIYLSFKTACSALHLTAPNPDAFRAMIGPPVQHIASKIFPELDPTSLSNFRSVFRQDYDAERCKLVNWYPHVIDTIRKLHSQNLWHLSVATNKPTEPTWKIVEAAGLSSCFSEIIGIDYLASRAQGMVFSSKAELLKYMVSTFGSKCLNIVYVGDTPGDQAACLEANIPFTAVSYGFHKWDRKEMPRVFIDCFSQLESLLQGIVDRQ